MIGGHEDDYIIRCSQAIQAVEETAEGSQIAGGMWFFHQIEPRKKPDDFPLNTNCLRGILILV